MQAKRTKWNLQGHALKKRENIENSEGKVEEHHNKHLRTTNRQIGINFHLLMYPGWRMPLLIMMMEEKDILPNQN